MRGIKKKREGQMLVVFVLCETLAKKQDASSSMRLPLPSFALALIQCILGGVNQTLVCSELAIVSVVSVYVCFKYL